MEDIQVSDPRRLGELSKQFVDQLIKLNIIQTAQKQVTSANPSAAGFDEDLAEIIKNSIVKWASTNNSRAGR